MDGRHKIEIHLQGDGAGRWQAGFAHGIVYRSSLQHGLTDEQLLSFVEQEMRMTVECITDNGPAKAPGSMFQDQPPGVELKPGEFALIVNSATGETRLLRGDQHERMPAGWSLLKFPGEEGKTAILRKVAAERGIPAADVGATGFGVAFDPSLSPEQVHDTLTALSGYFRACGGAGFEIEVAPDLRTEAEALFLRLDRIYAAADSISEIERTMEKLCSFWAKPAAARAAPDQSPASSIGRLRSKIKSVECLSGWFDLTPDQLAAYRALRAAEIEAQIKTHEFLNGLLPKPLDGEIRDAIYASRRDEFMSNNVGDGMDEDRVDAEVEEMSDWEFAKNFGSERPDLGAEGSDAGDE